MPTLSASSPHLRAVRAAYDAVERAAAAHDSDSQVHALVEAVWWISAANDYLRKLHGSAYETVRDAEDAGRIVKGMWWVRSAAMHDPFGVTEPVEFGDFYADTYTNLYGVFRWRPLHHIDLLDGRADTTFGRDEYAECLANGPPAIDTINDAIRWLHHLRTEEFSGA